MKSRTENKRDKIIGLCIARLQDDDSLKTMELIHRYAHEKNIGVVTYFPGIDFYDDDAGVHNADTLYMINYDAISALIVDRFKIADPAFANKLIEKASAHNVPVIVLNGIVDGAVSITTEAESAFEEILAHVITEHGARKIDLMLGRKGMFNSDLLVDIYKNTLEKNGIEFEEDRIAYGQYYGEPARKAAKEFLKGDKPDAIICANDEMAFTTCQIAADMGIKVPDDLIVTGIDGTIRSTFRRPLLTTCCKDNEAICKKAIDIIAADAFGPNDEKVFRISDTAVFAESCGCEKTVLRDYTPLMDWLYNQKETTFHAEMQMYRLSEKLMYVSQIGDMSNILYEALPKESFFCVKDSFVQDIFQEDSVPRLPGMQDKFYIIADNRENAHTWESFELARMCPDAFDMLNGTIPVIVAPVHYQNIQYGYIIVNIANYKIEASVLERYILNFNSTIGRYVGERKLRFANSELFNANESIRRMRDRDLLTGMFNTKGFLKELGNIKPLCITKKEKLVLVCVDLDGLGKINDIYGHSEGDVAIQALAKILQDCVGREGICAHLGSDEFVLALRTITEPEILMGTFFVALNGRLENYNAISSKEYSLEINETYLTVVLDQDTDMRFALDEALSRKRMLKQNRREVSNKTVGQKVDGINEEEYKLTSEIISGNKFKYAFQPIVCAKTGKIVAYEALMRADTERFISPLTILKYATMDDRLYEIEYSTFFNVLGTILKRGKSLGDKKIFVNSIPGFQLNDVDYAKLKRQFGKLFDNLVVEITEQTEMDDQALATIRTRSENDKFEVAIDDYGTGYSNTTSLLKYLPNYIKIDRMLITDVQDDPKKQHFVRNIIEFAHVNGFLALAEGVETKEELAAVIRMGADLIQGYYTAKPGYELVDDIAKEVIDDILSVAIENKETNRRKVYVAGDEEEIFLMRLALENYTGVIISQPEVTLVGNADYCADMQIRIKDGCKSKVHLKSVNISGNEEHPCIEIGGNAALTLVIEGDNYLSGCGIRVPESGSLTVEGDDASVLNITTDGEKSYAVGGGWDESVGEIEFVFEGRTEIKTEGTYSVGIGGGVYRKGLGTRLLRGQININLAGANAVGIGTVKGPMPIVVRNCGIDVEANTYYGVCIGTWNGEQDVDIANALVEISGNGNSVAGIGSIEGCKGKAKVSSAHIVISLTGNTVYLLGNAACVFETSIRNTKLELKGQGTSVLGVGSYDKSGMLSIAATMLNMIIKSNDAVALGANEDGMNFTDLVSNIIVNE